MAGPRACVDIGTNTVLMLCAQRAEAGTVRVLVERGAVTRLGQGVEASGRLDEAAVARTLAALREQVAEARAAGATRVAAVGTQALREAANAQAFLGPAAELLGEPVEIVSGEREAELSRRAVLESFPELAAPGLSATLMDVGGGSTEFVVLRGGVAAFVRSLKLGSVRLTERLVRADPPTVDEVRALRRVVREAVAEVPFAGTLVGIAGTLTTLAAVARGLASPEGALVHGVRLGRAEVEAVVARLAAMTVAQRRALAGMEAKRADVIVAGGCIVLGVLEASGASEVLVSDRGVRWGRWYELADGDVGADADDGGGAD
ncbi:MAG: Ppx/GppA family phosphatase [Deltaproteobacteria bacterium]|nr:Ppx/GppA family phosphatase [Deltaproteobacteria bacterium]